MDSTEPSPSLVALGRLANCLRASEADREALVGGERARDEHDELAILDGLLAERARVAFLGRHDLDGDVHDAPP